MKKFSFIFSVSFLLVYSANAQSITLDKNRVMDFFQNQQFDEAINYLSPFAVTDSSNLQLLSFLGYANYMNDDAKAAEKYYQRIFSIDSNNITANQYLANLKSNQSTDEAQPFLRRLMNLQPGKASHYRSMANLFQRKNQKDSALVYYNRAYQLSPNDFKNITGLANILIDEKKYPPADSIIESGLSKDSLNIACLKLRILSAYEAKDYQNAIAPGERLLRLGEPALSAFTQLALSYYNLKMYNDCIRICEYMQARGLAVEAIYYYEAKSQTKLKNYKESNELLKTCLSMAISKDAELYYYNLAENFEALKQFKISVSQYDTAYYLFKNPLMLYNCGRVCESNLKNLKLAKKYYSKYLTTAKPESADEKKAYQYVKTEWADKKSKNP
jgi:tetratricopeptide (TPR) repeat protein